MIQIQEWFDRLVGISPETSGRPGTALSPFGRPPFDAAAFQKPACWRRRPGAARLGPNPSRK